MVKVRFRIGKPETLSSFEMKEIGNGMTWKKGQRSRRVMLVAEEGSGTYRSTKKLVQERQQRWNETESVSADVERIDTSPPLSCFKGQNAVDSDRPPVMKAPSLPPDSSFTHVSDTSFSLTKHNLRLIHMLNLLGPMPDSLEHQIPYCTSVRPTRTAYGFVSHFRPQ